MSTTEPKTSETTATETATATKPRHPLEIEPARVKVKPEDRGDHQSMAKQAAEKAKKTKSK